MLCLNCLAPGQQSIADTLYEVIVTDDSKDNKAKFLINEKYPWVRWVEGPKRGPAANRNNGAQFAKGDWIVFIDDDCLPDANLLQEYRYAIEVYSGSFAFEGCIIPDDWGLLKKDMTECPVNTTGNCLWSANICINKNLFEQIRGFDEQFVIAAQEDQDIFKRVKEHTAVHFIKTAFVIHPVRIVRLSKKIRIIPLAVKNWYLFEKKNNVQNFKRFVRTFFQLLSDYSKGFILNISRLKYKSAIYHLVFIFIGIPEYTICFLFKRN
jgi:GT2 family glycosyltransferase